MALTLINPNLHLNLKLAAAEHRAYLALNHFPSVRKAKPYHDPNPNPNPNRNHNPNPSHGPNKP